MTDDFRRSRGRPVEVDREKIALVAMELFGLHGFNAVTMDQIAQVGGVSRRTLFRHFPSKNDLVWGDMRTAIDRVQQNLEQGDDPHLSTLALMHRAYRRALDYRGVELEITRQRLLLIDDNPSLYAHGIPQWEQMRQILASFIASREGLSPDDFRPYVLAHGFVMSAYTALVWWARSGRGTFGGALDAVLDAFDRIAEPPARV